ncbi:CBS domain-containing protein [Actinomycetospora termitidis]|uniref:CBS domain-containing protein n=1 Tax=Actinomycetospora termitidis TaxID=3053470 RepID=A0ABT7MFZ1_9PSEU|nr:CBS domain-containing protein [Actinomycetospora sp. Odt1-22]MDL5159592.1 CBS domain-containing protein [Actinomycetospora sp. Odt1-22]
MSAVMTSGVVTVGPSTPLADARALLTANRYSGLPVVSTGHRLVGILTTLDLLRAEVEGRSGARVADVMTRDPMTMTPDSPVSVLAHRLRRYGEVRVMPIVEGGVLVGIVTRGDLLRTPERRSLVDRLLGTPEVDLDAPPPDEPRIGSTAGQVMTPLHRCWVADQSTPVTEAAAWLSAQRLTALPVLDRDDRLLGVVSEADLLADRLSGRRGPAPRTCGQAMTTGATAVRANVSVAKVAKAMVRRRFRSLPVLGRDDRVVGMISRGDVLRAVAPPGR